jgi:glycosyltransferase involved in cell wall biosynthesis
MPDKTLLAIPVFNEQQYVNGVLDAAKQYIRNILVIDDGSTDGTAALLSRREGISIITHPENRGYGKSLADAFAFARSRNYDWLITMDCDEQHEPSSIPCFLESIRNDDADIISGTRYPQGHEVEASVPEDRREINRLITSLLNNRLGLEITDAFCGFKAYRVAALSAISITVPGYAMPMQFWVQAARAGLRLRELPIRLIYKDPTRHFGGFLDDPEARLRHYLDVFEAELGATDVPQQRASHGCLPCR